MDSLAQCKYLIMKFSRETGIRDPKVDGVIRRLEMDKRHLRKFMEENSYRMIRPRGPRYHAFRFFGGTADDLWILRDNDWVVGHRYPSWWDSSVTSTQTDGNLPVTDGAIAVGEMLYKKIQDLVRNRRFEFEKPVGVDRFKMSYLGAWGPRNDKRRNGEED